MEKRLDILFRCLVTAVILPGCVRAPAPAAGAGDVAVSVRFVPDEGLAKSEGPDRFSISDINLFVFEPDGFLTDRIYLQGASAETELRLPKWSRISLYACANLGFPLEGITTLKQLKNFRYYLIFPDDFRNGLPLCGIREDLIIGDGAMSLDLPMVSLFSRFTLSMDRTALDPEVKIRVRRAMVGGCPNSITPFAPSRAESAAHLFAKGFSLPETGCAPINAVRSGGRSGEIDLYALENLQDGHLSSLCTYIELTVDYQSPAYYSARDRYLTYRFHAGNDYDVERNGRYRYVIRPEGEGLSGDAWSVDRSRLGTLSLEP